MATGCVEPPGPAQRAASGDGTAGRDLVQLLADPASVGVVGASGDPHAPAGRPLRYLREYGFRGRVIAVNPRYREIGDTPCVPSVADLEPGCAEVGVVNLPAAKVPEAVALLGARGVQVAIVIGSGFEEPDGSTRQELPGVLSRSGLRLIGPNCVGAMTPATGAHLNLSSVRIRTSRHLELADFEGPGGQDLAAGLDPRIRLRNPLDVPFLDETPVFATAILARAASGVCDAVVAVESSLAHDRGQLADLLAGANRSAAVVLSHLSEDEPIEPEVVATLAPDLPMATWRIAEDLEAARGAARELGYPVVVKAAGRALAHRSEAGAVVTGVHEAQLADTFARVLAVCRSVGDAVVVQKQVPAGFELLVSGLVDPEVGPAVLVRPGGVLAELFPEQVVVWGGWSGEARRTRMGESRLGSLLNGYRGGTRYDTNALANLVEYVLGLLRDRRLTFVELNPVILWPDGACVVDVVAASREN